MTAILLLPGNAESTNQRAHLTWMTAIFLQPYFLKTFTLVGLCTVAEGWVRNKVGNLHIRSSAELFFKNYLAKKIIKQ
jgi:hypothetical protein